MNSALRARLDHAKKNTKASKKIQKKSKKRKMKGQL